jgi:phosphate transport system permease protein
MTMNVRTEQRIAFSILLGCTLLVVTPVLIVISILFVKGVSALTPEFLFSMPENGMNAGGILPAILGTLYLVLGAVAFAVPLGVLSAIYLVEYSRDNLISRLIRLAIVNLAGVPSVVYGLFGLGIFVIFFGFGVSILSGSLTLGIMILPVIITASREALERVPRSFRTVSFSLGASRWQTIRYAVLPHALPGILTGTILGLGRAAGETAPILFTVAAFYLPRLPASVFDQTMALPYHLYVISTQVPGIREDFRFGTALVLLLLVLLLNLAAIILRYRFRKKKKW